MKKIFLFFAAMAAAAVSACQWGINYSGAFPSLTYCLPYIAKINGVTAASVTHSDADIHAPFVTINNNNQLTTSPTFTVTIGVAKGSIRPPGISDSFFTGNVWVGIQMFRIGDSTSAVILDSSVKLRLSYSIDGYSSGTIRELNFADVTQSLIDGMTFTCSLPETIIGSASLTLTLDVIAGTPSIGGHVTYNTKNLIAGTIFREEGDSRFIEGVSDISDGAISMGHRLTLTVTGTRRPEASR